MQQILHATNHLRDAISRATGAMASLKTGHAGRDALAQLVAEAQRAADSLDRMMRTTGDILGTCSLDGTVLTISEASRPILGFEPDEIIGRPYARFINPDDLEATLQAMSVLQHGESVSGLQYRAFHRDGTTVWLEVAATPLLQEGAFYYMARDISAFKQYERLLRVSEQLYRALFEHSPDAVFSFDLQGHFVDLNPACERLSGFDADELLGKRFFETVGVPEFFDDVQERFQKTLQGESQTFETVVQSKRGLRVSLQVTTVPIVVEGHISGVSGMAKDITERKRAEEQLAHLAFHDPLTGLCNRSLFMSRLEQALVRSDPSQPSLAVLYLDLDDFKIVNDSLGHRAGDALLIEAARRLQNCVRKADTVARLGGDEFTILLEDTEDTVDAIRVAERILRDLRAPYIIDGHKVVVTPSVGVVMGNQGQDAKELLRYADIAMYQAKQKGKARYEAFTPVMYSLMLSRLQRETDLRRAVEKGEFTLRYQPIISLQAGKITGIEALIRWEDPERGVISPAEFIPLAEETGLILPIGHWVLEKACRQARLWLAHHPELVVSVNLSARQFQEPFLADHIGRILKETGLPPGNLQLEITETVLMQDAETTHDTLQELKGLGIQLAMDDFGTGYSSLSYLKRFPIDVLKIDRSFTNGLGLSSEDNALVQTVIHLAQALHLTVTGEGVETQEQRDLLRSMGCDRGQGYLFARPLHNSEAEELIRGHRDWT